MKIYVWSDGTVSHEPLLHMSDDFFIVTPNTTIFELLELVGYDTDLACEIVESIGEM